MVAAQAQASLPSQLHLVRRLATTCLTRLGRRFEASWTGAPDWGEYDRDMLAVPVAHHNPPLLAEASAKACFASRQLAFAPQVSPPYLTPPAHRAASSSRSAVAFVALHMGSFLAHHRTEGIGGGPCHAGLSILGDVADDGGVAVGVAGADDVADAPRAREAD